MEPDISILRKTGHFYFALTLCWHLQSQVMRHWPAQTVRYGPDLLENNDPTPEQLLVRGDAERWLAKP